MNRDEANNIVSERKHARASVCAGRSLMLRKAAAVCSLLAVMALIVAAVYGGSSLLSPGTSKVTAGDSFDFTMNVKSLGNAESEAEEALSEYVISVKVSPAPASLSVKEGVGTMNAVTGEYQVTSSQLGGTEVLHFTIGTAADLASETTYTVSANVTGSVSASDSFTLVAAPVSKPDDGGQNGAPDEGGGNAPDSEGGNVPDKDGGKPSGQKAPEGGNLPSDGKSPSGKNMPSGGKLPSGKSAAKGSMPSAGTGNYQASQDTASVTYAGSWDNYLDKLSVKGYKFTYKFNKIRDTYFLNVPEKVTSLDITAVPSDSSAAVRVTGNSDIPKGRSKVMISVTADDGSVRIYRIYVDRGEEDE